MTQADNQWYGKSIVAAVSRNAPLSIGAVLAVVEIGTCRQNKEPRPAAPSQVQVHGMRCTSRFP
jgi:hypothetical protein